MPFLSDEATAAVDHSLKVSYFVEIGGYLLNI